MLIDVAKFVIVDASVDGVDNDVGRWEIIGFAFLASFCKIIPCREQLVGIILFVGYPDQSIPDIGYVIHRLIKGVFVDVVLCNCINLGASIVI